MKGRVLIALATVLAVATLASVVFAGTVYTNPTDFQAATAGLGDPTVIDFDEIDASPVDNTYLGRVPFDGNHYADEGITFSNPISDYPLYIAPGGLYWNDSNSLSVGRFPFDPAPQIFHEDDDLEVSLDPPCIAVGFTLVDNGAWRSDEHIQFIDSDGAVVTQVGFPSDYKPYHAFIGIVSTDRPIGMIHIEEAADDGDDVNYDDFVCFVRTIEVDIDIKPGGYRNCVNINGRGVIPVAILGSADFDVTQIDVSSLIFAGLEVRVRRNGTFQCAVADFSGDFTSPRAGPDGFDDLGCKFVDDEAAWSPDDGTATVTGKLQDGTRIVGSDEICIVP
jgi:hypothetical protein